MTKRELIRKKGSSTNTFDDDEWIPSLREAQEITADIEEDRLTHDRSEADPFKVRPIQMGQFLPKCVSRRLLPLSEGELQPSQQQCGSWEMALKAAPKPWPSSASLSSNGRQEHQLESKSTCGVSLSVILI